MGKLDTDVKELRKKISAYRPDWEQYIESTCCCMNELNHVLKLTPDEVEEAQFHFFKNLYDNREKIFLILLNFCKKQNQQPPEKLIQETTDSFVFSDYLAHNNRIETITAFLSHYSLTISTFQRKIDEHKKHLTNALNFSLTQLASYHHYDKREEVNVLLKQFKKLKESISLISYSGWKDKFNDIKKEIIQSFKQIEDYEKDFYSHCTWRADSQEKNSSLKPILAHIEKNFDDAFLKIHAHPLESEQTVTLLRKIRALLLSYPRNGNPTKYEAIKNANDGIFLLKNDILLNQTPHITDKIKKTIERLNHSIKTLTLLHDNFYENKWFSFFTKRNSALEAILNAIKSEIAVYGQHEKNEKIELSVALQK